MSMFNTRFSRRAVLVPGATAVAALAGMALSGWVPERGAAVADHLLLEASPVSTPVPDTPEIGIDAIGLRFSPATIRIPANTPVRIVLTNRSNVRHDLVIPSLGRRMPRIGPGETGEILVKAEPGSYEFYCSIQSHHQAGMGGTLIAR
jgi:nitrite reductase (NO-forming)